MSTVEGSYFLLLFFSLSSLLICSSAALGRGLWRVKLPCQLFCAWSVFGVTRSLLCNGRHELSL